MSHKYVYLFNEGNATMRNLLGGKGANLAEMTGLGLPVPYGFTVSTEACTRYYEDGRTISDDIIEQIKAALAVTEEKAGKKFGSTENPFLVSVRSGARASMPGMMDTILNLGLNDETVVALANLTGNERFAYDSYRRFIQMFSDVVMEVEKAKFDVIFDGAKKKYNCELDTDLTADNLKEIVEAYKAMFKQVKGFDFPQEPMTQLLEAVKAVFRSWDNPRAIIYRRMNDIPSDWGTAVNVQSMVFGNMGNDSGTGVAFTRNPSTGEKKLYGEYLMNAQGEDVVAGIRTPEPIDHLRQTNEAVYNEFVRTAETLEKHYRDMQDMEFTIERGKLFMLQTRNGKRTAAAALQIAVDLVNEGMRTREEAIAMIDPKSLDALLHPTFDAAALKAAKAMATGLAASPGAACGMVYFSADDAKRASEAGHKVILARKETSPEDIEGMTASEGILTAFGGMTSHAAVVARQLGTCCVSGCKEIVIDEPAKTLTFTDGTVLHEGDWMSLDGSTGKVYAEAIRTVPAELSGNFATIMEWADAIRTLKIRTNADSPAQAEMAVKFGAEGIGLCRTEHMFFESDRIEAIREMICSDTVQERETALAKLLPMQQSDFEGIYEAMEGYPVTIRFLDPPLHEFLDNPRELEVAITKKEAAGASEEELAVLRARLRRIDGMVESNPMLGLRGVRLSVVFSDLPLMQVRAVATAAARLIKEGVDPRPEIMVPLVSITAEHVQTREVIERVIAEVSAEEGVKLNIPVGTMLELPRACMVADEIAHHADFFCFGTNDLTQMTFGFSRDDAEAKFIPLYMHKKILKDNPFETIDTAVLELVRMAVEKGRATNPDMHFGVCGEHGGDPKSIKGLFNVADVDYVSCSPYRVPLARLAAAQAKLEAKRSA